jgi:hypothetical protein
VLAAPTAPLDAVRAMMAAGKRMLEYIKDNQEGCDHDCGRWHATYCQGCEAWSVLKEGKAALTAMAGQFGEGQV